MFRTYFHKLIRSPLLYVAIIGTAVICMLQTGLVSYSRGKLGQTVVFDIDYMLSIQDFPKIMSIMCSLPFAANFASEWKNHVTTQCVTRCGVKKYTAANIFFCAISSFFAVMAGILLFSLIHSFFVPFCNENDFKYYNVCHGQIIADGHPFLYLLSNIFIFAVGISMTSVMGLMMSAIFPDKYIAVCTPLVFNFFIERLTGNWTPLLRFPQLLSSTFPQLYNPVLSILYTFALFSVMAALCGLMFAHIVKRRVRSEIA